MTVNLIAAIGRNGEIGRDGKLPWHRPDDLAWFKRMTMGGIVLVGKRTFRGMPADVIAGFLGRELFFYDPALRRPEETLLAFQNFYGSRPVWIAGGAHTWRAFAPFVDGLKLISVIDYEAADPASHVYFPFDAYGMDWKARA